MRKTLLIPLILLVVFVAGCIQNGPRCNPPYLEATSGSCCLDANQNSVCDKYEKAGGDSVKTSVFGASTAVTSAPTTNPA